jgi:hypothetical protein
MDNIERRVWREARAMTWREVITKAIAKQLTWVQAKRFWASALAICGGYGARSKAGACRR